MTDIERIPVAWTGANGLPGVSVFYGAVGASANADLKTFFTALVGTFPTGLTWSIPGAGDIIDDVTGHLSGIWVNGAGGGSVIASGPTPHASGVGCYVNWLTAGLPGTRRVMGRTFLCPLSAGAYEANGSILAANLTVIQTAAAALVTAAGIVIWHRPGSTPGDSFPPSAAVVPDQVTSLASRRR